MMRKKVLAFLKRNQRDLNPLKAVNFVMIHSSTTNLCSQYDPARTDDSKVENVLLSYLINSTLINNDIVTLGTIY